MLKRLLVTVTVLAFAATACSSASTTPPEAAPTTTEVPTTSASDSTWVLMGSDPTTQQPVNLATDTVEPAEPASAANQEAYAAAIQAMGEYVALAWEFPFNERLVDREAMGLWTTILHPDADIAKWSPGPTTMSLDRPDIGADLRVALWRYEPDAPLDERWYTQAEYTYMVTKVYTDYTLQGEVLLGDEYLINDPTNNEPYSLPRVAIERDASGRLLSVYMPWAVEVGFTLPEEAGLGRLYVAVGTAQFKPLGDSDAELALFTPVATEGPFQTVGTTDNVQAYYIRSTIEPGVDFSATPLVVVDEVPKPTIDVFEWFPSE